MSATHYVYSTSGYDTKRRVIQIIFWSGIDRSDRRRIIHDALSVGQYIAPIPTKYEDQTVSCDELTRFLDGQLDFPER